MKQGSFIWDELEKLLELGGLKKDIALIIVAGIGVFLSLFDIRLFGADAAWLAIIFAGIPIIIEAVIGLCRDFDITADVLVAMALLASIAIGETFAAGEVAFIMQLGALLEELTVAKARAGIEELVNLTPTTARRLTEGTEEIVPALEIKVGEVLRVLPGETIPVDGVIIEGLTSVNQAVMTGESLPVDKGPGDDVKSGTVNQFGAFTMKAQKVGEDSSIQRMIRLVQSADAGKAKIVSLADRWAVWIVIGAVVAAILTYFVTGQILRSVTVLVVFCPCALVLATPTAIMAAIGNVTKHGFLVREGDALERLASVRRIAFDKTGTLTYGKPRVAVVRSMSRAFSDDDIYRLAAMAERQSEHPLGKAVVAGFQEKTDKILDDVSDFQMLPGRGIAAAAEGHKLLLGTEQLLREHNIAISSEAEQSVLYQRQQGCTIIYAAVDGVFAGFLALSDTVRREAPAAIGELQALGVEPVLLTGDHEAAAQTVARQIGIRHVKASCLPETKLAAVRQMEESALPVCMIGDGVNDAPALKAARVGIAMGGVGSDIAVDAADIALVDDEVKELPHLFALSKHMMKTIRYNLTFSMGLNFTAIVLAMTGILNPVTGALVHNAGSVFVILNSALLLKWKMRYNKKEVNTVYGDEAVYEKVHG